MNRLHTVLPRRSVQLQGLCKKQLNQHQQKRDLYFALPVLLPAAVAAFVGITFWQVYKKRELEEKQARGEAPASQEKKTKHEDPRLR